MIRLDCMQASFWMWPQSIIIAKIIVLSSFLDLKCSVNNFYFRTFKSAPHWNLYAQYRFLPVHCSSLPHYCSLDTDFLPIYWKSKKSNAIYICSLIDCMHCWMLSLSLCIRGSHLHGDGYIFKSDIVIE
jgi:hypothetical protein